MKQNKYLENEDKLKYMELINYSLQINEHIHWSQKSQYLELIENFLTFKINGKTFESKFSTMLEAIEKRCRLLTKNYEILQNIKPSSISYDFAKWISDIYLCCDEFDPDFDKKYPPNFPFAKNEEDFRNAVADIFPQIQKY